ncbi:hypothetical protein FBU30_000506 [Linnemannia zychae]|nr:hypothetical protein FBU30_000506 [Linnemannia zychae]
MFFKISHGLQPIILSESAMVLVGSFSKSGNTYSISTKADFTHLYSYTRDDYTRYKEPCNHMYLEPRIYNDMEVSYEAMLPLLDEKTLDDNKFGITLEEMISPQFLLLLQKQ